MESRCKAIVKPPPETSGTSDVCADPERSTFSFVWPSLVRGQALNGRRDPLDQEFVRHVDARPWVGAGGCRCHRDSQVLAHRPSPSRRGQGTARD